MVLKQWAQELADGAALTETTLRAVDLHVADAAVAFFAGFQTFEGVALARFFVGDEPGTASPARLAAAVASIMRHSESDDIHVASCITPGSAVVPVALALAGGDVNRAARAVAAGYGIGVRTGLAIGGGAALATGIWPTCFAAPLMAAATASVSLGLDAERTTSALALAAADIGGRMGRITGAPSGRWLVFGEAVARGCNAAAAAAAGFQGDPDIVSEAWLSAAAPKVAVQPGALRAGSLLDTIETVGFKPFVAARQTINAIHALQAIIEREAIAPGAIDRIEVGVPTINAEMVARPVATGDRLGTIANMGIQIAAAAIRPALLYDVARLGVPDPEIADFANRVTVFADADLDGLLPGAWAGRVRVTAGGRTIEETCLAAPGDDPVMAETIVRAKLAAMVPQPYREMAGAQITLGAQDRAALWQAMLGCLRGA